jgi:uncharacterized protein YprB with RNaseH-like and TPR domain
MEKSLYKWWISKKGANGAGIEKSERLYREKNKPFGNIPKVAFREYIKKFRTVGFAEEESRITKEPVILYFDIETTDLSAGFGIMLMFSYCYHTSPEDIKIVSITDNPKYKELSPEKADFYIVQELKRLIDESDIQVAHFGSKFDIKFLQTRLILNGLQVANSKWKTFFDTCITARKQFKFGSNRLKNIARAMGCEHQKQELPLKIWQYSRLIGCEPYFSEAIEKMKEYCIEDTATLYDIAQPMWVKTKHLPSYQAITGKEGIYCPLPCCGSTNIEYIGIDASKVSAFFEYRCLDCGNIFRSTRNIREFNKDSKVMY